MRVLQPRTMSKAPSVGILLVGHGSRDPQARVEHEALEGQVRDRFPQARVISGFIELSEPLLPVALADIAGSCAQVVVVPLLLFAGGHMQRDLPKAIAAAKKLAPTTRFAVSQPFGGDPAAIDRVVSQLQRRTRKGGGSACLVVARGAQESEAQQGFQYVAQQLAARCPSFSYSVAYCGVQQPNVSDALSLLAQRHTHVVVAPYLLFSGKLLREVIAAVNEIQQRQRVTKIELCSHLGPSVIGAVEASIQAALDDAAVSKS